MKLIFYCLLLMISLISTRAVTVGNLRCEMLENPEGIDAYQPRLSWIQESPERGAKQTAWQVWVASSREALALDQADLWDSGKVETDQSIHVQYGGKTLLPGQDYFWKVRVWDKDLNVSPWSSVSSWSMGIHEGDWQGKWIGKESAVVKLPMENTSWIAAASVVSDEEPVTVRHFFRRSFDLPIDRRIRSGEFFLGVNGSFGSVVNGNPHGSGTGYRDATMVDIAPHLKPGPNSIALWVEVSPDSLGKVPALAGYVEIQFETGPPIVFLTDDQWLTSRKETAEWTQSNADVSNWSPASVVGQVGMSPWGEILLPQSRELAARMLRKEVEVAERPVRATLYLSGQGISECEINGKKVGNHVLSPALSEFDKRVFYVTHDVTEMLTQGKNAIGVHLGNGRYHAPRSKWYVMTRDYGVPRLLLQLQLEYADGRSEIIVSDQTWKVSDQGPIRLNNEFDGEEYDARMELSGWSSPNFNDSTWQTAEVLAPPGGRIVSQMIHPIRVTETLRPIAMTEPAPGVYVFDMGQNMVGWCRLTVSGPQGTSVKLRHAETLRQDGHLYLANMRTAKVTDLYHLKGEGTEVYEPRFTYHGFRFVEITGFPGKPTLDSIEGRVVHDDLPVAGSFESSSPMINKFHSNVRWGVRGNYRSIPTDCPQRDERQAWLGDRTFSSHGEAFMFDTETFYAKWLQDMGDAQKESGSISDVNPSYWPLYNDNVTWPAAAVMIPGSLLVQYSDRGIIGRHYPAMAKWIEFMSQYIKEDLIDRDNYGDWCVPPEDPNLIHSVDPARKTHPTLLATSYFCHCLNLMSRYATLLGKPDEAKRYGELATRMTVALNKKFYNDEKGFYDNGSQTSCVLPLAFGLVPEANRKRVFDHLVHKITVETKGHIGTGLIGGQWLNRVLTIGGRPDLVYGFATQTTYPSWGYMIENGATTVWELWNGNTANPAMNSGNHVMLVGDFIIWVYESLAGIKADFEQPGFKHILMRPEPVEGLKFVRASHRSPYGQIRSEWKREDEVFHWEITIPPNSFATIQIPCSAKESLREGGKVLAESRGLTFQSIEDGRANIRLEAGTYELESR